MDIPKLDALLDENKGVLYNQAVCKALRWDTPCYLHTVNCPEDAVFDLASVTKLLTTTMVLGLVGQNRLALDTTLYEVFATFLPAGPGRLGPVTRERLQGVTIRAALLHASGLPAWHPFYTGAEFWQTLEDVLAKTPPEAGTRYSDINFILLGMAVECVSGHSLAQNLDEINRALGTRFTYNPQNKAACVPTEYGNQCEMAMCAERGLVFDGWRDTAAPIQGEADDGNCWYAFGGVCGHAGAFGTADDLLLLGELYMSGGARGGVRLMPEDLARAALTDAGEGRGLGFDTGDVFPHGAGHTGFTGTALWLCPARDISAVLLASRLPLPGPPNLQPLRREAFTLLYEDAE